MVIFYSFVTCQFRRFSHSQKRFRWGKLFLLLATGILFSLTGCSEKSRGPIFKVSDKSYKSLSGTVFEAINSQVFLVGEHHDNPHHHRNQLEIIREMHEGAEKPMAIALEMFEIGYQEQLNQWVAGDLPVEDFIKTYYENWDQPWILYRDIFLYAREHQIPMVALKIPRKVVRKVAQTGFASLDAKDLSLLPVGITCNVTPEYENFIQRVFGWHGHRNNSFSYFCEAQVLWDTVMALNILRFHEKYPGIKQIVLAGDGHAWKPGIPRQISARENIPITVILPETEKLNRHNVSIKDADYLWRMEFL